MKNLDTTEGKSFLEVEPNLLVLDVRTVKEYRRGHIANSVNIPIFELRERIHELDKYKEKNILVHCARGRRSPVAVITLEDNGFKNLFHLYKGVFEIEEMLVV